MATTPARHREQRDPRVSVRLNVIWAATWTTLAWLAAHAVAPFVVAFGISSENAVVDVWRFRALSATEAAWLVAQAERTAERIGGWRTDRHRHYATTDLAVAAMDTETAATVTHWVEARIFPTLRRRYSATHKNSDARVIDLFVVKYRGGEPTTASGAGQRGLPAHRDEAQVSFGVALSGNHSTAATRFALFDHKLRDVGAGEAWLHGSRALHGATDVAADGSETRYVLVGFVELEEHAWRRWWAGWGAWACRLHEFRAVAEGTDDGESSWSLAATASVPLVSTRLAMASEKATALMRVLLGGAGGPGGSNPDLGQQILVCGTFLLGVVLLPLLTPPPPKGGARRGDRRGRRG